MFSYTDKTLIYNDYRMKTPQTWKSNNRYKPTIKINQMVYCHFLINFISYINIH